MSKHRTWVLYAILSVTGAWTPISSGEDRSAPPRIFGIDRMPRVDSHIHLRGEDVDRTVGQYLRIMDRVGIDVAIALSPQREYVDQMLAIRERYDGRLLIAPRPGVRGALWLPREELFALKQAGAVGTKIWVGYSPIIAREEFARNLADQGAIGLPVIGMHISDPPSGKTAPERFAAQIEAAIRHVEANPDTIFIMAHGFWLMTEARWLDVLDAHFERYPNLFVDLSATGQAFGGRNQSREALRQFMIKWQDRLLFGTDGNERYSEDDRFHFYWYRLLETDQPNMRGFFGGNLGIKGLALPLETLNYIYWWNAARLIPGVAEALATRGHPIDRPVAYMPPPAILGAEATPIGDGGDVRLHVRTDSPADVRWSFSNLPFARMSADHSFGGHETTGHETIIRAAGARTLYVSAAHRPPGHAMPQALAVPLPGNDGGETTVAQRGRNLPGYEIVAWEDSGPRQAGEGYRLLGHERPFDQVFIRFRSKIDAPPGDELALWQLAFQPAPAYPPEHHVSATIAADGYRVLFDLQETRVHSGAHPVQPGVWQEHVIRLDLHQNLMRVEVDGQTALEAANRQLAGMWGGGFDSVRIADQAQSAVTVTDVLILAGPGAYAFDPQVLPDRQAPEITDVFPRDGDTAVDPEASIAAGFDEPGIGLDVDSVVLELNGRPVQAELLGRLHGGFVAFNPPGGLPTGHVEARLSLADMSNPPNSVEKTWSFHVAARSAAAGERNLALHRTPLVDSTFVDRREPYVAESLTDGKIAPRGGSPAAWASGSPGREHQWVAIDFGRPEPVVEARVYPVINHGVFTTPRILIADAWDGRDYQPVSARYSPNPVETVVMRFPPLTTQRLRIRRPPFMGLSPQTPLWLTEVEIHGPEDDNGDENE